MLWIMVYTGDGDDVITLEGLVEIVTNHEDWNCVDTAYRAKYDDPSSGAQATIFEPDVDLYQINVHRVMAWEHGTVTNRTDWEF